MKKPFRSPVNSMQVQYTRLRSLMGIVLLLTCILLIRLGYLQILQFERYRTLSLKNQMSIIPIAPPRGIILDRNGVVLAENIPVYVLEIIPERVQDMKKTLQTLRKLLPSITAVDISHFNRARLQHRAFMPIPLKLKLTQEEVAVFATHQYRFPGVNIKARLMRFYPQRELTAHVTGYVGRINIPELQHVNAGNYRGTNFIGKSGIEYYYETLLHGEAGYQQVEIDVNGRVVRVVSKKSPISGHKLYLTLDLQLQKAAFDALQNNRGAVVALNPRNGEILAMVSSPAFDPNLFVNGIAAKDYRKLSNTLNRPLYNRAVRGLYPPASTIKPYVALAGLEKGYTDMAFSLYDPGWFRLPGISHAYRDWKKTGHGMMNVQRAIRVSCDTYFYHLGHKMGIIPLTDTLAQFGFGALTQVDLHEEAAGLLPNPAWKRKAKGLPWYPGDTLITAIGQGFLLASPLQLASAVATLSQHGIRYRPHLLQQSVNSDRGETTLYPIIKEKPVQLNREANWSIVTEAMHSVITHLEGTGYRFGRTAPYSVAAKTGTAQVFGGKQYENKRNQVLPDFLRDHSLFIAFAPVENPEIAIAVMVENDVVASNIARKVLDRYFHIKPIIDKAAT